MSRKLQLMRRYNAVKIEHGPQTCKLAWGDKVSTPSVRSETRAVGAATHTTMHTSKNAQVVIPRSHMYRGAASLNRPKSQAHRSRRNINTAGSGWFRLQQNQQNQERYDRTTGLRNGRGHRSMPALDAHPDT